MMMEHAFQECLEYLRAHLRKNEESEEAKS